MTGLSTYSADNLLNAITGRAAYTNPAALYLALFTAVGTDAGTGFTEVSGGGYARVSCAGAGVWGAASGTIPATITNSGAAITFPSATASWGNVIAWGLYDASTAGNLLDWDFLGNDPWFPCTITSASPGVVTAIGITAGSSPVLANGASVVFTAEYGGALPAALTQYTAYTVAGLSADTFNVGVNTAGTAACMVRQITSQSIPQNVTASFSTSSLTLTAA